MEEEEREVADAASATSPPPPPLPLPLPTSAVAAGLAPFFFLPPFFPGALLGSFLLPSESL